MDFLALYIVGILPGYMLFKLAGEVCDILTKKDYDRWWSVPLVFPGPLALFLLICFACLKFPVWFLVVSLVVFLSEDQILGWARRVSA